jgi:CRISPR/Cas system Type II protein with McrA/HNH and RuvC-like nuclease domain
MAIFIGSEEWVSPPIFSSARSYGLSWIVLDSSKKKTMWLTDQGEEAIATTSSSNHSQKHRSLPASVRFEILRRDGFTCRYCGRKAPLVSLQVDHIVPWSRGGTDNLSNLVTSCFECNIGKSDKLLTRSKDS